MNNLMQDLLTRFLCESEKGVLDIFSKLPGAVRSKTDQWVYIPGKRDDRILLVAHADTVHSDKPVNEVAWIGDVVMRPEAVGRGKNYGGNGWGSCLGADDRAGCAMWYNLFDGNHSVLITTGEERGCIGANAAVRDIGDELVKHQFAVQVDRRGSRQCVFYDVATDVFKKWMVAQCTALDFERLSWSEQQGSSTDIRAICPRVNLCGVNLSAGYWNEHSSDEMLLLGAWLQTRTVMRRLLRQKSLPKFVLPKPVVRIIGGHTHYHRDSSDNDYMFLMRVCEDPKLSRKGRKKLAKKIRKLYDNKTLQNWEARRLMDLLWEKAEGKSKEDKDKFLIPPLSGETTTKPTTTGGVVGGLYCDHGVLLTMSCADCTREGPHKSTLVRTQEGHVVVGDKVYCKECGSQIPAHAPICSFSASQPECSECKLPKGRHFMSCPKHPDRQGNTINERLCSQCQGVLPYHLRTCPTLLNAPSRLCKHGRVFGYCDTDECPHNRIITKRGPVPLCSHKKYAGQCDVLSCEHRKPKTPDPNDVLDTTRKCNCKALYLNGRQWHLKGCPLFMMNSVGSTALGSRVGAVHQLITTPKKPAVIVRTGEKIIVPVICAHWCWHCKRGWKHSRLSSRDGGARAICLVKYDSECPNCSKLAQEMVDTFNKELQVAMDATQSALKAAGNAEDCTAVLEHIEALGNIQRGED